MTTFIRERPSLMPGYHKYVFNTEARKFVGQFEEMYQQEEKEGFDSWFERDLRVLRKSISVTVLNQYNFSRILDVGCGKGTFTHLLKKENNYVLGIDLSPTAIRKAKEGYPDIDFRCLNANDLRELKEKFDLVVVMGTLAYVEGWGGLIETISRITRWFYVAEYIPPDPIGFVKSPGEVIAEVEKHFVIRTKILMDDQHCLVLSEVKQ